MIESRFKIILTSYNIGPKPQDEMPQGYMQSSVFGLKKKINGTSTQASRPEKYVGVLVDH